VARKLAVTLAEAADALGLPLAEVERLARSVEPYQHHDGTERWPLRELARVLADCGPVRAPWA
jgi:hypothetical protein